MRYLLIVLTITCLNAHAQPQEEAVKAVIKQLFTGMRNNDSALLKDVFADGAMLQTVVQNKEGKTEVRTDAVAAFITAITKPHTEIYDERITFDVVRVDGDLAIAWTPYKFYIGEKFSHCGVNSFQLVKSNNVWKIIYLIDTRRRLNCD